jgi:hypothetical protein
VPNWATIGQHGTGTGNEDSSSCTATAYEQLKGVFDEAAAECTDQGRRNRRTVGATQGQVECLNYLLTEAGSTLTAACPCMWKWGTTLDPQNAHWMEMNC